MKIAGKNTKCAHCAECLFGRPVTVIEGKDKEQTKREMCECHVARPTRSGFPLVRLDDFCSHHVDRVSGERTYAGFVPEGGVQ